MCLHLAVDDPPGFVSLLNGVGVDYDLLCRECADSAEPRAHLAVVCAGCLGRVEDDQERIAWRGEPEVRRLDRYLPGTWAERVCAVVPVNANCLAPLPGGWLALTTDGLVEILDGGAPSAASPVDILAEEPSDWAARIRGPGLHVSPDGRFVAVVTDYGRYGSVLDRQNCQVVRQLDRGDYYPETQPFPVAFVATDGGTVLLAATRWNRLDAFALETGDCLTEREIGSRDESVHRLDYFHGALVPSPSGRWLLDDGWVWHPVGIPTICDLRLWLAGDRYVTEHPVRLSHRSYAWDQPTAWVDESIVAVQRIGTDDEVMLDGVELFDVRTGLRVDTFAGPAGPMWGHGGRLYVNGTDGLEVWDPGQGARIGLLAGFHPIGHDPKTGAFAELADGSLCTWTPMAQQPEK